MFRVVTFLSLITVLIRHGYMLIFVFTEFVKTVLVIIIRITEKVDRGMSVPTALPRSQSRPSTTKFLSGSQSPIQNTKGLFYNVPHIIIVLLPRKVVGRKNKAQCVEATREGLQNIVLEHSW